MDNFTTFIDAYHQTGNTMVLSEVMIDDSNVAVYAKGLAGMDPAQVGSLQPAMASQGTTVPQAAKAQPGKPFKDENGKVGFMQADGKGVFPNGNSYMTTDETGWQTILDYYAKQSDLVNQETGDTENQAPEIGMDPEGAAEENEKLLRQEAARMCKELADACSKVSAQIDNSLDRSSLPEDAQSIEGCESQKSGGTGAATGYCNKMVGLNKAGRLSQFAREGGATAQERIDNAQQIVDQQISYLNLSAKIINPGFKLSELNDADTELLACLKLRGTGAKRGAWISGGEGCEGVIQTMATGEGLTGDERYGLMIGNQNTPLYRALIAAQQKNFEVGEGDDKHNIIVQGTDESGLIAWYNATFGRINEQMIDLTYCMFGPGEMTPERRKCMGDALNAVAKELGGNAGFQKMVEFLGDKLEDPESDFDFGTLTDKGAFEKAEEFYDYAEKAGIDLGNDKERAMKVLAYLVTQGVRRYETFAQNLPEGTKISQMGTTRAGVDGEGNIDNADTITTLPGGEAAESEFLDSVTQNPSFAVSDKQCPGRDDGEGIGWSVKEKTAAGKGMAAGSRGANKAWNDPASAAARDNVKCYAAGVCENHAKAGKDCGLEEGWEQREEEYREGVETSVDEKLAALGAMDSSVIKANRRDKESHMTYADAQKSAEFWDTVDEWKEAVKNGSPNAANLESALRNRMTIAQQAKDFESNVPGCREMMMVDALYTGGSTRDQGYLQTSPSNTTRVARESDIIGTAAFQLLNKDADISFTQGSINVKGVGRFTRRVKGANEDGSGGTNKQFMTIDPSWVEDNSQELAPKDNPVGNSAMKAEDFVRQLQELLQGIDKIFPIKD
jgi:hypothetical protein